MLQSKNIFICLFAVFLLLSSMGISLEKMICLSSGKSKVALFEAKECCPEEEETGDGFKSRCCNFLKEHIQVDYLSVENPVQLSKAEAAVIISLVLPFLNFELRELKLSFPEKPSLRSGYLLLKFISIFRI
jgi:hypothetical protein